MKTNVCVLIADGTEEMEAVIVVDVLRRAGISVFLAGVGGDRLVTTSRGVRIAPDVRRYFLRACIGCLIRWCDARH